MLHGEQTGDTVSPRLPRNVQSSGERKQNSQPHPPQEEVASQSRVLKDPGTKLVEDLQGRWHLNRPAQTNQGSP